MRVIYGINEVGLEHETESEIQRDILDRLAYCSSLLSYLSHERRGKKIIDPHVQIKEGQPIRISLGVADDREDILCQVKLKLQNHYLMAIKEATRVFFLNKNFPRLTSFRGEKAREKRINEYLQRLMDRGVLGGFDWEKHYMQSHSTMAVYVDLFDLEREAEITDWLSRYVKKVPENQATFEYSNPKDLQI